MGLFYHLVAWYWSMVCLPLVFAISISSSLVIFGQLSKVQCIIGFEHLLTDILEDPLNKNDFA
jgi:hypothetical protein